VDKGIINQPDFPAVCVPLERAEAFCKWLSAKEGCIYRLPTLKEWKRACVTDINRWWYALEEGTLNTLYRWDILHSMTLAPRGFAQSYPNPWGLHDMLRNVQEWIPGTVDSRPWTRADVQRRGIVGPGVQEELSRPRVCWQLAGCAWHTPGDLMNAPPWLTPFTMELQHSAVEDGVGFRIVCE
jgi:formylglycine-generating enzyme required for sulfatase activity